MSINSWDKIIEKEKYENNSRLRLNKWIEIILLEKNTICVRFLFINYSWSYKLIFYIKFSLFWLGVWLKMF